MKKAIALLLLMLATISLHAQTYYTNKVDLTPYIHPLVGEYSFQGDKHGDFVGDTVAILGDLSLWKVHPKHTELFGHWKIGERIHIGLRTSWYFFKREHKFTLVNHDRNETVYVMMIQSSNFIKIAEPPQYNETINGNPSSFRVNLVLEDGTPWEVESTSDVVWDRKTKGWKDTGFAAVSSAHVGYNEEDNAVSFFIINELEREATYRWARKGNYDYTQD